MDNWSAYSSDMVAQPVAEVQTCGGDDGSGSAWVYMFSSMMLLALIICFLVVTRSRGKREGFVETMKGGKGPGRGGRGGKRGKGRGRGRGGKRGKGSSGRSSSSGSEGFVETWKFGEPLPKRKCAGMSKKLGLCKESFDSEGSVDSEGFVKPWKLNGQLPNKTGGIPKWWKKRERYVSSSGSEGFTEHWSPRKGLGKLKFWKKKEGYESSSGSDVSEYDVMDSEGFTERWKSNKKLDKIFFWKKKKENFDGEGSSGSGPEYGVMDSEGFVEGWKPNKNGWKKLWWKKKKEGYESSSDFEMVNSESSGSEGFVESYGAGFNDKGAYNWQKHAADSKGNYAAKVAANKAAQDKKVADNKAKSAAFADAFKKKSAKKAVKVPKALTKKKTTKKPVAKKPTQSSSGSEGFIETWAINGGNLKNTNINTNINNNPAITPKQRHSFNQAACAIEECAWQLKEAKEIANKDEKKQRVLNICAELNKAALNINTACREPFVETWAIGGSKMQTVNTATKLSARNIAAAIIKITEELQGIKEYFTETWMVKVSVSTVTINKCAMQLEQLASQLRECTEAFVAY